MIHEHLLAQSLVEERRRRISERATQARLRRRAALEAHRARRTGQQRLRLGSRRTQGAPSG